MHLICPQCQARNRVAESDLAKEVNCGRCQAGLLPQQPVVLTDASFQRYVAGTELPVVVDYWAPWCGPCRMMAPQFEQAAQAMQGRAVFAKLDTEANPQTGAAQGIRSIPTLAVFVGGREVARQSGAMPAAELQRWVTSVLAGQPG